MTEAWRSKRLSKTEEILDKSRGITPIWYGNTTPALPTPYSENIGWRGGISGGVFPMYSIFKTEGLLAERAVFARSSRERSLLTGLKVKSRRPQRPRISGKSAEDRALAEKEGLCC